MQVDYLDTPGVGDMDVTPMKVLTLIEQELLGTHLVIFNLFAGFPIFFSPKKANTFWGAHRGPCISYSPSRLWASSVSLSALFPLSLSFSHSLGSMSVLYIFFGLVFFFFFKFLMVIR